MKPATATCFSVDKKYSKFHDMLIAYVWNVSERANAQIYVLTQQEAVDIATEMKYTATESWLGKGVYVVTRPGRELVDRIRSHEASRAKWEEKILRVNGIAL